jgi:hypothetical protein
VRASDADLQLEETEAGDAVLGLDALVALGLYYWLAEQCYVQWHA